MPTVTRTVVAAAGSIAMITLLARVVGFGRWLSFSHSVGATPVGTVYQSVNAVPNVIFEIAAGGVLAAVAIPLVAGALARADGRSADETASALLTWALVVLLPLGAIVLLAARPIASALLGTGPAAVGLGAEFLAIFAIQLPLYGVAIVLAGILQAHRRFVAAALAPLLSSLVVIATYLTYGSLVPDPSAAIAEIPREAVLVLGVGTTLGVAAMALPLAVPIRQARVRLRPRLRFPTGVGSRVRSLALAGLLAVAGQQLAILVVIRLANDRGGVGTLNVFTYAQAVALLPYAVLAVPLATAAFPSLAGAAALEGRDGSAAAMRGAGSPAATTLRHSWFGTLVVGAFGAAMLVAVAGPVGTFFRLLDAGDAADASGPTLGAMSESLAAFAPTVPALAVIGLLSRACYVRGRAVLAGAVVGLAWLATTLTPFLVLDPDRADGPATLRILALGSSVGLVSGAVVLTVLVARVWGGSALSVPGRSIVAAMTGAVAAAVVGWVAGTRIVATDLLGAVGLAAAIGVGSAAVMAGVALTVEPSLARRLRQLRRPVPRSADTTGRP
ncbi:MAG TPA: lipid II flippase MurJ [Intrasporangium sp.]|uniref:murein biosynthesis integral membrane protein MurJ n=1 Tax=Intrasporangium sp. TaxID=1925024 RepID=UPI002B49D060|nr:lipid II flippase MurJ [Intrasporangium sp.]HKX67570.1 lipid II flippase MurJ [Intrasporangium sp.]